MKASFNDLHSIHWEESQSETRILPSNNPLHNLTNFTRSRLVKLIRLLRTPDRTNPPEEPTNAFKKIPSSEASNKKKNYLNLFQTFGVLRFTCACRDVSLTYLQQDCKESELWVGLMLPLHIKLSTRSKLNCLPAFLNV